MNNKRMYFVLFTLSIVFFALYAGERTIPVDMIIMIDKSISMEEPGKFDDLQKWVLDELIGQMLIEGDWVSVYQFYENAEHLISLDIKSENDKNAIFRTVSGIKPDGKYTDVGKALETIEYAVQKRGKNEKYKVLLLVTDLEQDAPWTSKYAGKQKKFSSPYLAEARIIKHSNWYEITLDMDIQERVVKTTQALFSNIMQNDGKERSQANQQEALIKKDK